MTKDQEHELVVAAEEGVRNAYTKHGRPEDFRIGAAVLTDRNTVYSSGNYYSDSGSLSLHAEQAALAHAAAHGEYRIVALAVTGNAAAFSENRGELVYPCHMCKQVLYEHSLRSGKDIEILMVTDGEIKERFFLGAIMQYTWPPK